MRKAISILHTGYAFIVFVISCIFFLVPQILLANNRKFHPIALKFNTPWARVYFTLLFFNYKVHRQYRPKKGEQYIICANHFSYLDIPVMPLIGIPFKYIGKSSVSSIPVFGYMFKKIHIMVDRDKLRSRVNSFMQASAEIADGFNIVFFPEGGVKTQNPPQMVSFRDGAFRLALERNIQILPVVLQDNYKILPDDQGFRLRYHRMRLTIMDPIRTDDPSYRSIESLRNETQKRIQEELDRSAH